MPPKDLQTDIERQLTESQAKVDGVDKQSPFPQTEKSVYTPNPSLKTLRTYQGDIEETMGAKKTSIVSIVTAQQESTPKKNLAVIGPARMQDEKGDGKEGLFQKLFSLSVLPLVGLISIVVGVILLAAAYYFIHYKTEPVPVATNQNLVPQSNTDTVLVNQSSSLQSQIIAKLSADNVSFAGPAGAIEAVQFLDNTTRTELSENVFFQTLALGAPDTLTRAMNGNYFAGIYAGSKNQVFFLFSTESYGQAYAGMLAWEPIMVSDFGQIFPVQNIASTSATWSDDTFDNQDVRVLRTGNGPIELVYGFLDNNTILITANEDVFQAIANKYLDAKLVH